MRRDFEEKLRSFSQAQTQFEADKRRALEELRANHRQEVEDLLKSQQNQSASSTEDQEKLAELHRQEVGHGRGAQTERKRETGSTEPVQFQHWAYINCQQENKQITDFFLHVIPLIYHFLSLSTIKPLK